MKYYATYTVDIPDVLSQAVGPAKVKAILFEALDSLFEGWAHPALVEKIKITKTRNEKE